jgi:hypothetical protein
MDYWNAEKIGHRFLNHYSNTQILIEIEDFLDGLTSLGS